MSEYRGVFSKDGLWWWTGTAWMPARPPDGSSARWNGSQWVPRAGRLGAGAFTAIALTLSFAELVWAVITIVILVLVANAQYEAAGRVGTESITSTPASVPLLLSLLIVPVTLAILAAANLRQWWAGVLLGGWPAIGVGLLALVSPGSGRLETIAAMSAVIAGLTAIGWLVQRIAWPRWEMSPDGQQWVSRGRSFPTISTDGRWRWDGRTWQPRPLAVAEKGEG